MRILALSTSTNNTNTFLGSLECLGTHEISVMRYDQRWHDRAYQIIRSQPTPEQQQQAQQQIQSRQIHIGRDDCAMDEAMLGEARLGKPDAIVYISAWSEDFCPLNETLGELNQIAPVIHFLSDAADPPWWPQLQEFERRGCFALTVAIDGNHMWPGGCDWPYAGFDESVVKGSETPNGPVMKNSMTLLTPIDTRFYPPPTLAYGERPYAIGYAGNAGGPIRSAVVQRLQGIRGFAFRERDGNPNSYAGFADFLRMSRIAPSIPFTGSGTRRHVKGRIVEAGYAGCTLLEWVNDATRSWLTPRLEYEEYGSVEECAELAEWLAHHPKRAEDIARALTQRIVTEHSPAVFWNKVLERVGK